MRSGERGRKASGVGSVGRRASTTEMAAPPSAAAEYACSIVTAGFVASGPAAYGETPGPSRFARGRAVRGHLCREMVVRLWVLGSGSDGNAAVIEEGDTRILVDAGFSGASLARRLAIAGVPPESIDALILTHGHSDHVQGAAAAVRRWRWPVYMTPGTMTETLALQALAADADAAPRVHTTLRAGGTMTIGALELQFAATQHDAREPIAVACMALASGERAVICTDTGLLLPALSGLASGADLLLLESNHDPAMLAACRYPVSVQARIGGDHGHLSNAQSADAAALVVDEQTRAVVLGHLSRLSNTPGLARGLVSTALRAAGQRPFLTHADQDSVIGPMSVGEADAAEPRRVPVPKRAAAVASAPVIASGPPVP